MVQLTLEVLSWSRPVRSRATFREWQCRSNDNVTVLECPDGGWSAAGIVGELSAGRKLFV